MSQVAETPFARSTREFHEARVLRRVSLLAGLVVLVLGLSIHDPLVIALVVIALAFAIHYTGMLRRARRQVRR